MIFAIILIGHLLADFYFQSSEMAKKKQKKFKYLLKHSVIYFLVIAVLNFVFVTSTEALIATVIITVTHFIIDWIRTKIDNKTASSTVRFASFLIDQILHIGIIWMTCYLLSLGSRVNGVYSKCASYPKFDNIVLYSLLFVVLLNPAAVFVKKLFIFLFDDDAEDNSNHNAGSVIGKLERVITSILLLCNQYGVIGLVLTAKSIARFKQLEEKDFAEKYLVGTLTSLAISLIVTIIVKSVVK